MSHSSPSDHYCCSHCSSITLEIPNLTQRNQVDDGDTLSLATIPGSVVLDGSIAGCIFFKRATTGFYERQNLKDEESFQDWSLVMGVLKGHIYHPWKFPFISLTWHYDHGVHRWLDIGRLTVCTREDDPAASYISSRPTKRNMVSKETVDLVKGWLSSCQYHHELCNEAMDDKMPSMIIEINLPNGCEDPSLRLVLNPTQDHYAALSYCWGGDQPIKTTRSTIKQFCKDLQFSDLPATIKDAVLTTWRLSIRFLWIDSLCIVQDDPNVVEKEIALMPQIYQNAYITISAARSTGSQEGFLQDRSVPRKNASVFNVGVRCPDGSIGSAILCHEELQDPIEQRAWPLQEYLLSRRVLKYGSHQLSWSCQEVEIHEKGEAQDDWFLARDANIGKFRRRFINFQNTGISTSEIWGTVLQEYTSRRLTEPKDRLLAVSGISTAIGVTTEEEYVAGLWRQNIAHGLMWYVELNVQSRPSDYRAPSWSWASVEGVIDGFTNAAIDPELRILSCNVTLTQATAQYGSVSSGYIQLLGNVRPAYWTANRQNLIITPREGSSGINGLAFTKPDADEGANTGPILVWCLQIRPYEPSKDEGPVGLILTTENGRVYKRVGLFYFDPFNFTDEELGFYDFHRRVQQRWVNSCQLRHIRIE